MMWTLLLISAFVAVYTVDAARVVCYYTNWSQYRTSKAKFLPENVDPSMCTHVIYAFAKITGTDIKAFEWNDDSTQWTPGMYERMMNNKVKNPNLKILLGVGGYNMGSLPFTLVSKDQASRSAFTNSAITFLRQRNFDGLDMDWEYPTTRGGSPQDKQNFALLIQELMRAFENESVRSGKPRLLLTGAFSAGKDKIDSGYDLPTLVRSMDFLNLMAYDFHGSWEKQTGFNSPLFAHQQESGNHTFLNVDWVARYYVSKGVPKDKLVIGLATYGRSFTLDSASNTGVFAPASQPGQAGTYTQEKGFLAYYEICEMLQNGAQSFHEPSQRSRYVVQGRQWVGYDDVQAIQERSCYAKQNGFGGIMFWALDLDDFTGQTCGQGRYPLMTAAINEFRQPSLANCVRRAPITGQNPVQPNPGPGVVTYRPTPFPSVVTYRPTPFPSLFSTQRPTIKPAATQRPNVQPGNGQRPAGYVPINPPNGAPANPPTFAPITNAPFTNAPVTNAPFTFAPVTNAPFTFAPVTNAPFTFAPAYTPKPYNPAVTNAPVTPAPTVQNPYAFTLPTYGVNTPKPPSGVTFLPGVPNQPSVTAAPAFTNAPVVFPRTTQPAPTSGQSVSFDCLNRISDFYPDPTSCDHFFICANKVTYRVPCASGLKYNSLSKHCDWSYNVNCQGRPSLPAINAGFPPSGSNTGAPTPAPTLAPTQAPTQKPVTAPQNPPQATNACANQQTGFQPHPTDCNKFFQCNFGSAYLMSCPGILVFNPSTKSCDFRGNVPGCP